LVFVMKMLYGFCDVGTTFLKKIVCWTLGLIRVVGSQWSSL
jgi:hypothetical protein